MKSPVTKKKYSRRLEMFFDFIKIPGETLKERCLTFVNSGRNNINWVFTNILKFVLSYKERIDKKEISGATRLYKRLNKKAKYIFDYNRRIHQIIGICTND